MGCVWEAGLLGNELPSLCALFKVPLGQPSYHSGLSIPAQELCPSLLCNSLYSGSALGNQGTETGDHIINTKSRETKR